MRTLDLEACLQRHLNGVFVELGRLRIEELEAAGAAGKATRALVTTKNVIIALGVVAVARTALFTFGDRFWFAAKAGAGERRQPNCRSRNCRRWALVAPPGLPVAEMTRIQRGDEYRTFTIGSNAGSGARAIDPRSDHRPAVPGDRAPITCQHYVALAETTGRTMPAQADFDWNAAPTTLPLVAATWHNARNYAEWIGEQTCAKCRLPSEAQWEVACRAGTEAGYWLGDSFGTTMADTSEGGTGRPTPVGTFPSIPNRWRL